MCRIGSPLLGVDASLHWLRPPPTDIPADSRFYVDGSAMDPSIKAITTVGFAIVVVSQAGELLGLGSSPLIDSFPMVIGLAPFLVLLV